MGNSSSGGCDTLAQSVKRLRWITFEERIEDTAVPRLLPESILHTDSTEAYKQVGPMRWPEAEILRNAFETQESFLAHGRRRGDSQGREPVQQKTCLLAQKSLMATRQHIC